MKHQWHLPAYTSIGSHQGHRWNLHSNIGFISKSALPLHHLGAGGILGAISAPLTATDLGNRDAGQVTYSQFNA